MTEERHLAGVGHPAALVRDVADPRVVVGVGVEIQEPEQDPGEHHPDYEDLDTGPPRPCPDRHGLEAGVAPGKEDPPPVPSRPPASGTRLASRSRRRIPPRIPRPN